MSTKDFSRRDRSRSPRVGPGAVSSPNPEQLQRIRQGFLIAEAIEVAHGRRHLTVVHGDPTEVAASRQLSEFYEELRRLAGGCEWVRVRGNAEYVAVTVGGALAEEQIALFEAAAAFANPGDWTIVASAVPPLS